MNTETLEDRPVDIAIPFYRNSHLVSSLFQSLAQAPVRYELARLRGCIIAVNDSPDDPDLTERLRCAVTRAAARAPCELLENDANIGFVRSVNRVFRRALDRSHDVILLNSDTIVYPGAFSEMRHVAYLDPMIGFVSPRSNNATICSLPHQDQFRAIPPAEGYAIFRDLQAYLPRFQFVPVATGFCLFIKWEVLKEFGVFDESYSPGYNEENDLIMRANRCGYRAALANRAWVYHLGEASFSISQCPKQTQEEKNARLLNQRFPEYQPSIRRYFSGSRYEAECLLPGLLPDRDGRVDLLVDFSSVGPYHNGTFLVGKKILERAARLWPQFNVYVMVSDEACRFHELDQLEGVSFVPLGVQRKFAVGLRLSQPFSLHQMSRLSQLAAVNVYGMLDPIALDCLYLNSGNPEDLETLWAAVFAHADGVVYISDFVGELFRRRFQYRKGLRELVAYPSLDPGDYKNPHGPCRLPGRHILVIGNRFEHKRVSITVDELSKAFPKESIVVLSSQRESRPNMAYLDSGHLETREMHELYSGAQFVVFPSLYEGFGLPVIESLAHERPVLARSIPVIRTIRDKIGRPDNLMLFSSTSDLIERLRQGFPAWRADSQNTVDGPPQNWDSTTLRIGAFLQETLGSLDFDNVLLPRIHQMHLLGQGAEVPGAVTPASRDDELAAAVREHEIQMRGMYASWSWKLTSPVRWLGEIYLRAMK
jgi:GT2 family glycosyltransferase